MRNVDNILEGLSLRRSTNAVNEAKLSGSDVMKQKRVHRYLFYRESSYHYNVADYDIQLIEFSGLSPLKPDPKFLNGLDLTDKDISYGGATVAQVEQIGRSKVFRASTFGGSSGDICSGKDEASAIEAVKKFLDNASGTKNRYAVVKSKFGFDKDISSKFK